MQKYQYIISILTPLLTGEISLHIFGILNGSGDISLLPFGISVVSILVFDTVVYATAQILRRYSDTLERIKRMKVLAKFQRMFQKCEEKYNRYPALLLFAIKIMPMTKFTIFFYALCSRVSIVRFVLQNIVVTSIWAVIMFLPGWFVGKEFLTQEAGRKVSSLTLYFLILVVAFIIFSEQINKLMITVVNKIVVTLDRMKKEKGDTDKTKKAPDDDANGVE